MSVTESDIYYDPYDFEIDADPYPVWKRMRDEVPLYYNSTRTGAPHFGQASAIGLFHSTKSQSG